MESKKGPQNCLPTKATSPLDFFRERGAQVIEESFGWVNFYPLGEYCYLENMFIHKEFRKTQHGTSLLNRVELSAKEVYGCKYLTTTISKHFGDPEPTLKICKKRGFEVCGTSEDAIILIKEL